MQPGVRSTTTGTMASEKINAGQLVFLVVYSANTRGMVGNIRMINLDKVKKLCSCPVKTEIWQAMYQMI